MNMIYFAHNGVDHGTAVEAAGHQSSNELWVVAVSLAAIGAIIFVVTRLSKSGDTAPTPDNEEDE